jgi:hypothetical protein
MSKANLTTTQAAERLGVGKSTVNLWCRQGRFPNAFAQEEARGPVWYIPVTDLEGFNPPTMGRPKKAMVEQSNGRKKAVRAKK